MKIHLLKIISVILVLCTLSVYLPVFAQADSIVTHNYEQVELWKRTDVILKSDVTYQNPYKDVEIDATFTHEDGTKISLYGFWNGDDEWRVRFAPTKLGVWSYKITCSNTADTGLHNKTGKLLAVKNTGDTALDKHGFVKISENGRYFTYDDGTPFYWLGDTNWQAPNYVSISQCNYPDCLCGNQFLHEVNDRLEKGFTVYQTYFDSGESDGGGQLATTPEPSLWTKKYDTINPDTFTNKFDIMFDTLADKGMVIALGLGVHSHTTNAMGKENLDRISRYLTARYASYPIVWITAQEITGEPQFSLWNSSAKIVDAGDGYHHPQGAHQFPSNVNGQYVANLDKQEWHEFYALQAGHGPTYPSKTMYEGYWNNKRLKNPKPFVETEANYEDIVCGGFNGYEASRIAAWKANLSGSYGFTYGVTGVWANNYSTAGNIGWYGSFSFEPWYMGIDKPGSYEMTYLRRFFEYADFSKLVPRFNDEAYSNLFEETKVVSASDDHKTYAAYFYNASTSTGELRGLNQNESYSAKWYNPLTGKFIEIAKKITIVDGVYTIPQKPTAGDWALLVTSRTDLGEYTTEKAYTDEHVDNRTNLALEATGKVSSDNSGTLPYGAAQAIDGDAATYWCAANGNYPQWLLIDLGKSKSFKEIDLYLYNGQQSNPLSYASFDIETSADGETFTKLYSADKEKPILQKDGYLYRITKDATCRYLKVTFHDVENNWAAVSELAIYEEPSEEKLEDVEYANILTGSQGTISATASQDSGAFQAIDGNESTWWCAPSDNNHWIAFDMKEKKAFNSVSIVVYGGTTSMTYTLETSTDGKAWTPIYEAKDEAPSGKSGESEVFSVAFDQTIETRYLRLNVAKAVGNWITVVEIEAKIATEGNFEALPTYSGTLQKPGIQSSGTQYYSADGLGSNSKDALTDGDLESEWTPFGPIATQTVIMDLYEAKQLYGMHILLGVDAFLPEYRIMGSLDGENWTMLVDATLREAITFEQGSRLAVSETLSGSYRYVKLLWLNATGNGVIKTISEIELYAEGATKAAPEAADTSDLLALYNQTRKLNNSDKRYAKPSFYTFSKAVFAAGALLTDPAYATQKEVNDAKAALEGAYNNLVERLGDSSQNMQAYLSARQNGDKQDLRVVISADNDYLDTLSTLSVQICFEAGNSNNPKSQTYILDPSGKQDFSLCRTVTGGGKTYEAIGGNVLFGAVITDIPANSFVHSPDAKVRITVRGNFVTPNTDTNTLLYEAECLYSEVIPK